MTGLRIVDLNEATTVASGDMVPIASGTGGGNLRKATLATIATFMQNNIVASGDGKVTQYSAPSASPFTVAVTDSSESVWLILTPTGTLANGTVTLPAVANAIDRQEILVNCTQIVTALTVAGNGATAVTGAPTTLAANGYFRLRYEAVTKTWYRVG